MASIKNSLRKIYTALGGTTSKIISNSSVSVNDVLYTISGS